MEALFRAKWSGVLEQLRGGYEYSVPNSAVSFAPQ